MVIWLPTAFQFRVTTSFGPAVVGATWKSITWGLAIVSVGSGVGGELVGEAIGGDVATGVVGASVVTVAVTSPICSVGTMAVSGQVVGVAVWVGIGCGSAAEVWTGMGEGEFPSGGGLAVKRLQATNRIMVAAKSSLLFIRLLHCNK